MPGRVYAFSSFFLANQLPLGADASPVGVVAPEGVVPCP